MSQEFVSVPRDWLTQVSLMQMSHEELQDQAVGFLCEPCDEPVPPAGGEVEVLPKRRSYEESFTVHGQGQIMGWNACLEACTPIVTRLQADLQAAYADKDSMRRYNNEANERIDELKAEVKRLNQHSKELQNDKSSNYFNHAGSSLRDFVNDSSLLDVLKLQDVANTYIREGDVSGALTEVAAIIGHISALQSELTKALELLASVHDTCRFSMPSNVYLKVRDLLAHQSAPAAAPLDHVHGDVLPPVGSTVQIQLGDRGWFDQTVTGYYVWPNHGLDKNVHRVFVRVKDAAGTQNARLLADVRIPPLATPQ